MNIGERGTTQWRTPHSIARSDMASRATPLLFVSLVAPSPSFLFVLCSLFTPCVWPLSSLFSPTVFLAQVTSTHRNASTKVNSLKMAMSQWESMLDLYVADLVGPPAPPPPPPQSPLALNSPAPPPPPASAFDFDAFKREHDLDNGLDFRRDSPKMEAKKAHTPTRSRSPNLHHQHHRRPHASPPPPTAAPAQLNLSKKTFYDEADPSVVASTFLARVTAKLRELAGVKAHFTDLINAALDKQATKWKFLYENVSGTTDAVHKAQRYIKVISEGIVKSEASRMQREMEIRQGIVKSETLLMGEKENIELELHHEREIREKLSKEVDELKVRFSEQEQELETLATNFSLAQKGLAAGKQAVEDALKRIARMTDERNTMGVENDELVKKNLILAGDRARLLDICERMKAQVGYRDSHLAQYAGDVLGSLGRAHPQQQHPQQQHPQQQQQHQYPQQYPPQYGYPQPQPNGAFNTLDERNSVMVSDTLVARELEATRLMLGGEGMTVSVNASNVSSNSLFSPTFLRTTPGNSAVHTQRPPPQTAFGAPAVVSIAPPRDEQERRRAVQRELDGKMSELAAHIDKIEEVTKVSASLLDRFETLKRMPGAHGVNSENVLSPNKRVAELENECYQLLDSNARIALQLQQLGLDLQRVYRRFKTLEVGGAAKKERDGVVPVVEEAGGRKEKVVERSRRSSTSEMSQLYKDLQQGAPHMEGEEQAKAYRMLEQMEQQHLAKGGGGHQTPQRGGGGGEGSNEKLLKIGDDLQSLSQRLEGMG